MAKFKLKFEGEEEVSKFESLLRFYSSVSYEDEDDGMLRRVIMQRLLKRCQTSIAYSYGTTCFKLNRGEVVALWKSIIKSKAAVPLQNKIMYKLGLEKAFDFIAKDVS